jgi:hypothetical protein
LAENARDRLNGRPLVRRVAPAGPVFDDAPGTHPEMQPPTNGTTVLTFGRIANGTRRLHGEYTNAHLQKMQAPYGFSRIAARDGKLTRRLRLQVHALPES